MKFLKSLCGLLSTILLIAIIVMALLLGVTAFLGQKLIAVRDDSMDPEFTTGYVLTAETIDADKLSAGQLVAYFNSEGIPEAHRVIKNDKNLKTLTTKADTSLVNDAPVPYDDVIGHITMKLPMLGYAVMFIGTLVGKICAVAAIVLFIVLKVVAAVLDKKIRQTASSQ